jgi:hypothetical protein
LPINVAGVTNSQPANAIEANWGYYWRVDAPTAKRIAYNIRKRNIQANAGILGLGYFFNPVALAGFYTLYNDNVANNLDYCADTNGSAYFKIYTYSQYFRGYGWVKIPYAIGSSCN